MDDVMVWNGPDGPRRIDEMSREELIEVVRQLGDLLDRERFDHGQALNAWQMSIDARRRVRA